MILFPNCKINLGLEVTARRDDGFHEIQTLMYPVGGLCDILEIVPGRGDGIKFSESGVTTDCPPSNNLCVRAFELMKRRYGIGPVKVHLHKMVPSGAGLGGGSADAAFTIKGLNSLFGLGLGNDEMKALASQLGSDTAFFIDNVPQMATGRGELLTPFGLSLTGKSIVIVKPHFGVSTAEAYGGITPIVPVLPLEQRLGAGIATWKETVENRFETHIFRNHPQLNHIKEKLYRMGAVYASMSGSGSAMYGIFDSPVDVPDDLLRHNFVYQQVME